MTELRDLLDFPTEVKKSDFVVRLSEGVQHGQALLANTALTPGLMQAFDAALSKAFAALRENRSWATYVHGSFGSGKSHYMALLSLMIGGDLSKARELDRGHTILPAPFRATDRPRPMDRRPAVLEDRLHPRG